MNDSQKFVLFFRMIAATSRVLPGEKLRAAERGTLFYASVAPQQPLANQTLSGALEHSPPIDSDSLSPSSSDMWRLAGRQLSLFSFYQRRVGSPFGGK